MYCSLRITVFCVVIHLFGCAQTRMINRRQIRSRNSGSSQIKMKKLPSIEIYENIPIGQTIIDLKANLNIDDEKSYESSKTESEKHFYYYNFQFIDKLDEKYSSDISKTIENYFLLDSFTGKIKTSKIINLENFCELHNCQGSKKEGSKKLCSIPFKIKAYKSEASYHILFDLIIKDVNEFAPKFDLNVLSLNVTEEFAPIRLPIGRVAHDEDCSDQGSLTYSIRIIKINDRPLNEFLNQWPNLTMKGSNILDLKVITDPANMLLFLYTYTPFDREKIQNVTLNVIASDRLETKDAKSGTLTVEIKVVDINDNSPQFTNEIYNLEFDEGLAKETKLIQLNAKDPDAGLNGKISYEFTEMVDNEIRNTFMIESDTGYLILKKQLNTHKKLWQISVRATDQCMNRGSRKSSITIVNIKVNDINNHKPEINVNFFHMPSLIEPRILVKKYLNNDLPNVREEIVYLTKNLPKDTIIGIVSITDEDTEWNGMIGDCVMELISNSTDSMPVKLENFEDLKADFEFSSDLYLNNEMKFLFGYDLNNIPKSLSTNERRYFIRTTVNFSLVESSKYEIKLITSDKGKNVKHTSEKNIQLFILSTENNLISQKSYDYDEYPNDQAQTSIDTRLQDHIEFHLNDYSSTQYYFSKSIYKVFITEKNPVPIQIAKFDSSDFEMNSKVKYDIILPHEISISYSNLKLSETSKHLIRCSVDLNRSINLDSMTGILTLNKSLSRDECTDYLYFIKATDVFQNRLSSMMNFKLHITSNEPKFQHKKHAFNITENTQQKIIDIKKVVKIFNNNQNVQLRLDSLNDMNQKYFEFDEKDINIIIKSPPNFEIQNKFIYSLVINYLGKDIDSMQIEINVLDQNEFKPAVNEVKVAPEFAGSSIVNISRISDDYTYLVTTNLTRLLALNHSMYFDLIKIDSSDQDGKQSDLKLQAEKIQCFDLVNEVIKSEIVNKLNEFNTSQFSKLFLIDSFGNLKINLQHLSETVFPTVVFFRLKLNDKGIPPLETPVNINLILNRNLPPKKYRKLQAYMVDLFSSAPNFFKKKIFPIELPTKNSKIQSFKSLFKESKMPILIISILAILLVISLGGLFIISIVYSVSIFKIFRCGCREKEQKYTITTTNDPNLNVKDFDDEATEETEETEDDISDSNDGIDVDGEHICINEKASLKKDYMKTNQFNGKDQLNNKLTSFFCSSQECDHEVCLGSTNRRRARDKSQNRSIKKESNLLENQSNGSVFLDSPITLKKLLESDDHATQKTYANKYNLEYLLGDQYNARQNAALEINSNPMKSGCPSHLTNQTILYSENKNSSLLKADSYKSDSLRSDFSTPVKNLKKKTMSSIQKKLSFKDPILNSVNSDEKTNSSSEFDDDYILPGHKNFHSQMKNFRYLESLDYNNNNNSTNQTIDGNILKRQDAIMTQHEYLSYKKAQLQPEDNIWIKKIPSMPYPTSVKNSTHLKNHIEVSI